MRIEPTLNEVVNGPRGICKGIEISLEAECLVSAMALIFSAMDSLAALNRPVNQQNTTQRDFEAWVQKYLVPEVNLKCSAVDLYSARCGVLHTYSSESDLARRGKARQLIYQWRHGPNADAGLDIPGDAIVIEVEALHDALRAAIQKFLIDSEMDSDTKFRVTAHLPSLLCYAPWPTLRTVVAA